MADAKRQLDGLLRWLDLIGRSDLDKGEKNIARVLLRWADKLGRCWPAIATIAAHAGMTERGVQRILDRLEEKGVLRRVTSRGGAGRTSRLRLDAQALEARCPKNPDPRSGLRDAADEEPRPTVTPTPTHDPENPDPGSGEEIHEETNEPPPPGGGGGRPLAGAEDPPAEEAEAALTALADFGVSASVAARLARLHSLAEVKAAVAWVQRNARNAESPPAILVGVLQDGTAKAELDRLARAAVHERAAELRQARMRQLRCLREYSMHKCPNHAAILKAWDEIDRAWPSPEQLADSGVLSDNELFAAEPQAHPQVVKLQRAARAVCNPPHGSTSSPTEPRPTEAPHGQHLQA